MSKRRFDDEESLIGRTLQADNGSDRLDDSVVENVLAASNMAMILSDNIRLSVIHRDKHLAATRSKHRNMSRDFLGDLLTGRR